MILSGRGVTYLEGAITCPFAGVGSRGPHASNRLALDDEHSQVRVEGRRIVLTNQHRYPTQTLIGDLMLMGEGETAAGPVTFVIHTRFDKRGTTVRARPHLHPSVRGSLTRVAFEPFEVLVRNGTTETRVFWPELGHQVVTHPPLASWLGRALLGVRHEPRPPGEACLIVSAGVGPLARDMCRAEVRGARAGTLRDLLAVGGWQLRLTALSSFRSAKEHLARAIFVLGLDGVPLLGRMGAEGLGKGETLAFRLEDGRGTVSLGGVEAELPNALDVARAFLELDFLGAILARALTSGPTAIVL